MKTKKINLALIAVLGFWSLHTQAQISTVSPGRIVVDMPTASETTAIIRANYTGTTTTDFAALHGDNSANDYLGFGVIGTGGYIGVGGEVYPTGENDYTGVYGYAGHNSTDACSNTAGVYGTVGIGEYAYVGTGAYGAASFNVFNYGVYGDAPISGLVCGENPAEIGYAGYFNGNLAYTGSLYAPSDARLKNNSKSLNGALDKVMQLSPKSYEYKHKEFEGKMNLPQGKQFGFIAQELQEVFPEAVGKNVHTYFTGSIKDKNRQSHQIEYIGVNYMALIPILTKAIQEQQQSINAKDAELDALKQQLAEQRNEIEQIKKALANLGAGLPNHSTDTRLAQNIPNPFNKITRIPYVLPNDAQNAVLVIHELGSGKELKRIPLAGGVGEATFERTSSGAYTYSLYVNNRLVSSMKMVSE